MKFIDGMICICEAGLGCFGLSDNHWAVPGTALMGHLTLVCSSCPRYASAADATSFKRGNTA